MYCTNCGAKINEGTKVCKSCGANQTLDDNDDRKSYNQQPKESIKKTVGVRELQKNRSLIICIVAVAVLVLTLGGILLGKFIESKVEKDSSEKITTDNAKDNETDKSKEPESEFAIIEGEWAGSANTIHEGSLKDFKLNISNVKIAESGKWIIDDCLLIYSGIDDTDPTITLKAFNRLYGYYSPKDNYLELMEKDSEDFFVDTFFSGYLNTKTNELSGRFIGSNGFDGGVFTLKRTNNEEQVKDNANETARVLSGEWTGTYEAGKGTSDVSLNIYATETSTSDTWEVSSTFNFLSSSPYYDEDEGYIKDVFGTYTPTTNEIEFDSLGWLSDAFLEFSNDFDEESSEESYADFIDENEPKLTGTINMDTKKISGKVMFANEEIGTFTLTKSEDMLKNIKEYFNFDDTTPNDINIMTTTESDSELFKGEWSGVYNKGRFKVTTTLIIPEITSNEIGGLDLSNCEFNYEITEEGNVVFSKNVKMKGRYDANNDNLWLEEINPSSEADATHINGYFTANAKQLIAVSLIHESEDSEYQLDIPFILKKGEISNDIATASSTESNSSSIDNSSAVDNASEVETTTTPSSDYDFLMGTWSGTYETNVNTTTVEITVTGVEIMSPETWKLIAIVSTPSVTSEAIGYYTPSANLLHFLTNDQIGEEFLNGGAGFTGILDLNNNSYSGKIKDGPAELGTFTMSKQ